MVPLVWCSIAQEGFKDLILGNKALQKRALSEINGILKIVVYRIMLPDGAHDDVMHSSEDE